MNKGTCRDSRSSIHVTRTLFDTWERTPKPSNPVLHKHPQPWTPNPQTLNPLCGSLEAGDSSNTRQSKEPGSSPALRPQKAKVSLSSWVFLGDKGCMRNARVVVCVAPRSLPTRSPQPPVDKPSTTPSRPGFTISLEFTPVQVLGPTTLSRT